MKRFLLAVPVVVLLAAGCNSSPQVSSQTPAPTPVAQTTTPTPSPTSTLTPTTAPTSSVQGQVYENQYLKVTVPTGWTAKEAVQVAQVSNNGKVSVQSSPNPAALNITKGNYILYINARASQASGIEGGRFEEYAGGAPSVDALIVEHPGGPCGTGDTSDVVANGTSSTRTDYYVNAADESATEGMCLAPTNGKTLWYVSVVGNGINSFDFPSNDPEFNGANGWVVTMAYNSSVVNSFPVKGSAALNEALSEMTAIVNSLTIKLPVAYVPQGSQQISNIADTSWSSAFSEGAQSQALIVGCTDTTGTHNISQNSIQSSFDMEGLGPNTQDNYTSASQTAAVVSTAEGILVSNTWSKCNSVTAGYPGLDGTVDVYEKGNEIVDVDNYSVDTKYPLIEITFFKLNS